jgi:hypothetical protein
MSEIPEDVMQAAREAAAKVWGSGTGSEELAAEFRRGMRDDSGSVETAVVAILAERERSQCPPLPTPPKPSSEPTP